MNATILDSPENSTASIGMPVSFTCSASGVPLPDISWLKDGSLLNSDAYNITDTTNGTYLVRSVLVIENLQLTSAGKYSCTAFNNLTTGQETDTESFTLQVYGKEFLSSESMSSSLLQLLHSSAQHHCCTHEPDSQPVV